uniref:Glycolipid transfer protein domain-containing protein n=1 Tax=Cynoglossus semilaevis TaxID=244447 RepID=A0A3P8W1M9_CYNSE
MALLMEHQFRQLDRQVETRPFLEAVSYLPSFFGVPTPVKQTII